MSDDEAGSAASEGIDVPYWSSVPYWTPTEFEWLALGVDPERIEDPEVTLNQQPWKAARAKIRARFDRLAPKENRNVTPAQAVELAKKMGIQLPPELVSATINTEPPAVDERQEQLSGIAPRSQHLTALQKKNATLQKLLLIIAIGAYDWNPLNKKSGSTVNKIVSHAERLGLRISEQTVTKHLQDAFEGLAAQDEASIKQSLDDAPVRRKT